MGVEVNKYMVAPIQQTVLFNRKSSRIMHYGIAVVASVVINDCIIQIAERCEYYADS